MHIEVMVEEASMEAILEVLLPVILGGKASYRIINLQDKHTFLKELPRRLQGYNGNWIPGDYRILVLLDRDSDDCRHLKARLEAEARDAGLVTRSSAGVGRPYQVLNRLAIEELEAWFFGDIEALATAYEGISPYLGEQAGYRDPDDIRGGTWEALLRELQRVGYYQRTRSLPKTEVARNIAPHMDPPRNRSRSFQVFYEGLLDMLQQV